MRLLERTELQQGWSPLSDGRPTVWESTQHLIQSLVESESAASQLLGQLGGLADRARQLAYLLYRVCEAKGWAEEAIAYNGLITAWPELTRLATDAESGRGQRSFM
jgi:putative DNA methylase